MVQRYPNLKEKVGGSIPDCEISFLLDEKLAWWSTASCALTLAYRPSVSKYIYIHIHIHTHFCNIYAIVMHFRSGLLYFHDKQVKAHQTTNAAGLSMGRWVHGPNLPMSLLDNFVQESI